MQIDDYIRLREETLFPMFYPYKLQRVSEKLPWVTVLIGVPVEQIDYDNFDIDKPTSYTFHPVCRVKGRNEAETVRALQIIEWDTDLKEKFC